MARIAGKMKTKPKSCNRAMVFVALWAVLSGCATSASSPPAWVTGRPDQYPESEYITAAGSGGSLEAARTSAKAELARIFSSRVESEWASESLW